MFTIYFKYYIDFFEKRFCIFPRMVSNLYNQVNCSFTLSSCGDYTYEPSHPEMFYMFVYTIEGNSVLGFSC